MRKLYSCFMHNLWGKGVNGSKAWWIGWYSMERSALSIINQVHPISWRRLFWKVVNIGDLMKSEMAQN